MTRRNWLSACIVALAAAWAAAAFAEEAAPGKIRVAVVTGGHPFAEKEFLAVFDGHADVAYTHVAQTAGGELFANVDNFPYDVILFYNFNQRLPTLTVVTADSSGGNRPPPRPDCFPAARP